MKLNIDSKVGYDVNVNVITEDEAAKYKLKAEGHCKIDVESKAAVLTFEESKTNFLLAVLEKFIIVLVNYIYYCISYEDFSETRLLSGSSPCIKTTINALQNVDELINIQYMTEESPNKKSVDIAKVVSGQGITVDYELDETKFVEAQKQWVKESMLYMVLALLIIIAGIGVCILKGCFLFAIIMGVLFLGLAVLIYKFVGELNRKMRGDLEYLKYRLNKLNTGNEFTDKD